MRLSRLLAFAFFFVVLATIAGGVLCGTARNQPQEDDLNDALFKRGGDTVGSLFWLELATVGCPCAGVRCKDARTSKLKGQCSNATGLCVYKQKEAGKE